jgi:predicted acetyltransferase
MPIETCMRCVMPLEVKVASVEERPILRSHLDEYLSELRKYGDVGIGYPYFDGYWRDQSRWPYSICEGGQLVGFAFVNGVSLSGKATDFSLAEFYIVPKARGRGIGRDAADIILSAHRGIWELRVMRLNTPAQKFWPSAIEATQAREIERINSNGDTIYRFRIG